MAEISGSIALAAHAERVYQRLLQWAEKNDFEVLEGVPGVRLVARTRHGPRITGNFDLVADGNATKLNVRNEFEMPGGVLGKAVAAAMKGSAQGQFEQALEKMRADLEADQEVAR